jgi:hypothetical protein
MEHGNPTGPDTGEETGEPRVDELIARLDALEGLPLDQHVALYDDIHAGLRQVLSELDSGATDADAR